LTHTITIFDGKMMVNQWMEWAAEHHEWAMSCFQTQIEKPTQLMPVMPDYSHYMSLIPKDSC